MCEGQTLNRRRQRGQGHVWHVWAGGVCTSVFWNMKGRYMPSRLLLCIFTEILLRWENGSTNFTNFFTNIDCNNHIIPVFVHMDTAKKRKKQSKQVFLKSSNLIYLNALNKRPTPNTLPPLHLLDTLLLTLRCPLMDASDPTQEALRHQDRRIDLKMQMNFK